MGLRIMPRRKLVLLSVLLVLVVVGIAFAAIYYSIIMQPSVTITGAEIVFVQGNDWPSGSQLGANSTWASLALNAYPNATLVYDQPLNVSNTDSANHTFRLRHVSIIPASGQPEVGNFTFVNFVVLDATGISQASFNYTTAGNTWTAPSTLAYMTLPADTQWIIYVETKATAGANGVTANIQIAVDVQQ